MAILLQSQPLHLRSKGRIDDISEADEGSPGSDSACLDVIQQSPFCQGRCPQVCTSCSSAPPVARPGAPSGGTVEGHGRASRRGESEQTVLPRHLSLPRLPWPPGLAQTRLHTPPYTCRQCLAALSGHHVCSGGPRTGARSVLGTLGFMARAVCGTRACLWAAPLGLVAWGLLARPLVSHGVVENMPASGTERQIFSGSVIAEMRGWGPSWSRCPKPLRILARFLLSPSLYHVLRMLCCRLHQTTHYGPTSGRFLHDDRGVSEPVLLHN